MRKRSGIELKSWPLRHSNPNRYCDGFQPEVTLDDLYEADDIGGKEYPFSVKPARKEGVDDIKRALSTHYEGMPWEVKDRHPANNHKDVQLAEGAATGEEAIRRLRDYALPANPPTIL